MDTKVNLDRLITGAEELYKSIEVSKERNTKVCPFCKEHYYIESVFGPPGWKPEEMCSSCYSSKINSEELKLTEESLDKLANAVLSNWEISSNYSFTLDCFIPEWITNKKIKEQICEKVRSILKQRDLEKEQSTIEKYKTAAKNLIQDTTDLVEIVAKLLRYIDEADAKVYRDSQPVVFR